MRINVLDRYVITSDKYQYIFNEIDSAEKLIPVGYYSTIVGLLNGLMDFHIRKSDINEWKDLAKEMKRTNEELTKIRTELEKYKIE